MRKDKVARAEYMRDYRKRKPSVNPDVNPPEPQRGVDEVVREMQHKGLRINKGLPIGHGLPLGKDRQAKGFDR